MTEPLLDVIFKVYVGKEDIVILPPDVVKATLVASLSEATAFDIASKLFPAAAPEATLNATLATTPLAIAV